MIRIDASLRISPFASRYTYRFSFAKAGISRTDKQVIQVYPRFTPLL